MVMVVVGCWLVIGWWVGLVVDGAAWEMGDAPADAEASRHDTEFPSIIYIRRPHMNLWWRGPHHLAGT